MTHRSELVDLKARGNIFFNHPVYCQDELLCQMLNISCSAATPNLFVPVNLTSTRVVQFSPRTWRRNVSSSLEYLIGGSDRFDGSYGIIRVSFEVSSYKHAYLRRRALTLARAPCFAIFANTVCVCVGGGVRPPWRFQSYRRRDSRKRATDYSR